MNPKKYNCNGCEKSKCYSSQRNLDDCREEMIQLRHNWNIIKQMDLSSEANETVFSYMQDKFDELKNEMVEIVNSLKLEM